MKIKFLVMKKCSALDEWAEIFCGKKSKWDLAIVRWHVFISLELLMVIWEQEWIKAFPICRHSCVKNLSSESKAVVCFSWGCVTWRALLCGYNPLQALPAKPPYSPAKTPYSIQEASPALSKKDVPTLKQVISEIHKLILSLLELF